MEHAIRKHCKVNEGDDPVMYKRFSDKLEEVLKKYNESWEQMVLALDALRDEIDLGRGPEPDNKGPFFDLIATIAFDGDCPTGKGKTTQTVIDKIMDLLAEDIRSLNFWEQPALISELEGKLLKVFVLSKEPAFKDNRAQLVTEVLALARRRERSILDGVPGA
jgi:type I restriction enzyme R subunit